MKTFTHTIDLPSSADNVLACITTEEYLRFRYQAGNVKVFDLAIDEDTSDSFRYTLTRQIDTSGQVPRMARKMVGDSITVTQKQHWNRGEAPFTGELNVEAQGMPGNIGTETRLEVVDDNSSRLVATGKLQVNVPVIGGQLEKLLEAKISESIADSIAAIRDYVAKQSG